MYFIKYKNENPINLELVQEIYFGEGRDDLSDYFYVLFIFRDNSSRWETRRESEFEKLKDKILKHTTEIIID